MKHKDYFEVPFKVFMVVVLLIADTLFVYHTGGIKYAYSHTMYLTILLGGYFFGFYGGFITAAIGGILLGPWMPVVVETGEMQSTINWVYRIIWFLIIGGGWGAIITSLRSKVQKIKWVNYHNPTTGLRTIAALEDAYKSLLDGKRENEKIGIFVCAIKNFGNLVNTFGYKSGEQLLVQFADRVLDYCPENSSVFQKRMGVFVIVSPSLNGRKECDIADDIKKSTEESFLVDQIPVHLELSIGTTASEHANNREIDELVRQAAVAQEEALKIDRCCMRYSSELERERKQAVSLLGQIRRAIKSCYKIRPFDGYGSSGGGSRNRYAV